jgi:hypothetical protein
LAAGAGKEIPPQVAQGEFAMAMELEDEVPVTRMNPEKGFQFTALVSLHDGIGRAALAMPGFIRPASPRK